MASVRVVLPCRTCQPNVLILEVPANPRQPDQADQKRLLAELQRRGWALTGDGKAQCPDCVSRKLSRAVKR